MKNIKNNIKLINYIIMRNNLKIMRNNFKMDNFKDQKLIEYFSIINQQRWLIKDELRKLGFEDNYEIQRLYIQETLRQKYLIDSNQLKTSKHHINEEIKIINI